MIEESCSIRWFLSSWWYSDPTWNYLPLHFHFQRGGHIYVHLRLITTIGNLSSLLQSPATSKPCFHQSSHPLSFRPSGHRSCTHYLSLVDIFKYFEVSIWFHFLSHMFPGCIFLALSLPEGFPYYCSAAYYSRYEEMSLLWEFLWERK